MINPAAVPQFTRFSPSHAARFLTPDTIALMTTHHLGHDNVMALGWHTVLSDPPPPPGERRRRSYVSCVVSDATLTHSMLLDSGECVINLPSPALLTSLAGIGHCSGREHDKFALFGLDRGGADTVAAPTLPQCAVHLECHLHSARAAKRYNLFVLEVTRLRVRRQPRVAEVIDLAPVRSYSSSSMSQ